MQTLPSLQIKEQSRVPKYVQLANFIGSQIKTKSLPSDTHLPSINLLCAHHNLSRDTVRKAYLELKRLRLVEGVRGKGYYVYNHGASEPQKTVKMLVILDKLGRYGETWYQSFKSGLPDHVRVDIRFHHGDPATLKLLYETTSNEYTSFLVVGIFPGADQIAVRNSLRLFPSNKTILLENCPSGLRSEYSSVIHDWGKSLYETLQECATTLTNYNALLFHFERSSTLSKELLDGFQRFCINSNSPGKLVTTFDEECIEAGKVYIITSRKALISLIDRIERKGLKIGLDVGLIFVGGHPGIDAAGGSITVLKGNAELLGSVVAADFDRPGNWQHVIPTELIRRVSL